MFWKKQRRVSRTGIKGREMIGFKDWLTQISSAIRHAPTVASSLRRRLGYFSDPAYYNYQILFSFNLKRSSCIFVPKTFPILNCIFVTGQVYSTFSYYLLKIFSFFYWNLELNPLLSLVFSVDNFFVLKFTVFFSPLE